MDVNGGDLQVHVDVDVILEKYYVGCKYKATTWYLKKNQNALRPSELPLVKTKQRQCSTPSSMVSWKCQNNTIYFIVVHNL